MGKIRYRPMKPFWPLLLVIALAGCRKEEPARWDVDLLAPLIKTTFTISDLVADSMLITGGDGLITIIYRDELFALQLDTVIQSPDTSFFYKYALPIPGSLNFAAGVTVFDQQDVTNFDLGDVQLRTLIVREGFLDMDLINMVQSTVLGTFQLPGATIGGTTPQLFATVGPGTPATPGTAQATMDLSGAHFDLRGPQFDQVNTLSTHITAQLDPNGSGATVSNQDSIIVVATYREIVPQYARGFFGERTIEIGPDSTEIDIFRNIVGGSIDLDEVTLRVLVENGLGVDIQAHLHRFTAFNSHTGNSVDLAHTIMSAPINLTRAIETGGGFQPSFYQNELDNSDSNVDLFLENMPDRIHYELDLDVNPLGDISNGNDFLYYDSRVRAELELEIPLDLIATDLTLQSELSPELSGSLEQHALLSGGLRIFADNGFPFSAELQIEIVNENGEVLSTLPVKGTIASGILGPDQLVASSVSTELSAMLTADQVNLLYSGGKFRIRSIFNTADQSQHIRILDSYKLELQVTAAAHYMVNGNE